MAVKDATRTKQSWEEVFFARLGGLGRGDLAILRRNAGRTLGESRNALSLFYRVLPSPLVGTWDEETFFLAATLFALNQTPHSGDFGSTMRAVDRLRGGSPANTEGREGPIDRRMRILLDSEFERFGGRPGGGELAYRLRQCVKLAASEDVGIEGPLLLRHLRSWDHPNRWVQKQWARSYFGVATDENETAPKEAHDAT
jgi:CRISPR system Cascade subunit CasB